MDYNGWKNRQTWNVALYIQNTEAIYRAACAFMRDYSGRSPYADFIKETGRTDVMTSDGISYTDPRLSKRELNAMMRELID